MEIILGVLTLVAMTFLNKGIQKKSPKESVVENLIIFNGSMITGILVAILFQLGS